MTKYYYIDPLAAAWMDDKFGMRFIGDNGEILILDRGRFRYAFEYSGSQILTAYEVGKYNIAEGSLPILGPCGDELEFEGRTMERDGMLFHWPIIEDVT